MSIWATIEAEFTNTGVEKASRLSMNDAPFGSEGGMDLPFKDGNTWYVHGRLRDFNDYDAPKALAWFAGVAWFYDEAKLTIDIDRGPRYRYVAANGKIERLRGLLE